MALRVSGSVKEAAAAIGKSPHSAYEHRQKDPGFDANWQAQLDDFEAETIAEDRTARDERGVMPNRVRYDGFTPLRQRAFLRALSETGDVRQACELVRISNAAAYKMREKYPSFAAAWDRALVLAPATLEQAAFERAVEGIEEPVFHAGKQVGTRRRYSDSLMRELLATRERKERLAREEAAAKVKMVPAPSRTPEEALASLIKKLETAERRVEDDRAEEAAEEAAEAWRDWQTSWARFGESIERPRVPVQEILPPLTAAEAGEGARLRRA